MRQKIFVQLLDFGHWERNFTNFLRVKKGLTVKSQRNQEQLRAAKTMQEWFLSQRIWSDAQVQNVRKELKIITLIKKFRITDISEFELKK